jgi:hypothetical protein
MHEPCVSSPGGSWSFASFDGFKGGLVPADKAASSRAQQIKPRWHKPSLGGVRVIGQNDFASPIRFAPRASHF